MDQETKQMCAWIPRYMNEYLRQTPPYSTSRHPKPLIMNFSHSGYIRRDYDMEFTAKFLMKLKIFVHDAIVYVAVGFHQRKDPTT